MNSTMHALKVLEFDSVLQRLQFHCETSLGAASSVELKPSFDEATVWALLDETSEASELLSRFQVPSMGSVRDYRPALRRASKGAVLGGPELFGIAEALAAMRAMKGVLVQRRNEYSRLGSYSVGLPEYPRVESRLHDSIEPDGFVKDGASPALASLRQRKKTTVARIQERIQSYTTGKTRDLLSDPIYTVRDGRYVIPLKAENRGKIRGIVHDTSGTGQTIFLEPEDVLQLGNSLREIEAAERQEEHKVLAALSESVGTIGDEVSNGIEVASCLDVVLAKARLGFEMRAVKPDRKGERWIQIQGGRHPLIDPKQVVPLDIVLGRGSSVLITGPNTGGKTVAIKAVGLFVAMAQAGMLLPAIDVKLGPFTQIWADIGDEQSLEQSLSTFSGHIKNIGEALKFLQDGALVLLDEIGAGTDPAEGAALAQAVLHRMSRKGATILASTHYGELKAFAYTSEGFQNAAMEFDSKTLRPTYRLLLGLPGASQALRIAEKYGIPTDVIEASREYLGQQAQDLAAMFDKLETSQKLARIAQSDADKRSDELKRAEEKAAKKLAEADEIRRTAQSRASEMIEAALREIRLEALRLFDELKKAPDAKSQARVRQELKSLQEIGHEFAEDLNPVQANRTGPLPTLRKGMAVKIDGYSQTGTLVAEPDGKTATVQVGSIRLTVATSKLHPTSPKASASRPHPNVQLQKALTAETEVHLRNMRAEDAMLMLDRFVDDAVLGGVHQIRIVHGKGEGILRKLTQNLLRKNPNVSSFRDGEPGEGGAGVTIALFK